MMMIKRRVDGIPVLPARDGPANPGNGWHGHDTGGGSGMGSGMGGMGMRGAPHDCTQAANPEACAHPMARSQAREACKVHPLAQRAEEYLHEQMQKFDCAKATNPRQYRSAQEGLSECRTGGPAFRQCVQQKMPPVDCSKAAGQQLICRRPVKPAGQGRSDHMACLRAQFSGK